MCFSHTISRHIFILHVSHAPHQQLSLIDAPLRRVAVDLIRPILSASEKGYRYILISVYYASTYLKALRLKIIETEVVTEALIMSIYSRLGMPEEVLSNLGTRFVSNCIEKLSRLLWIIQLTTTRYHLICNGLESTSIAGSRKFLDLHAVNNFESCTCS